MKKRKAREVWMHQSGRYWHVCLWQDGRGCRHPCGWAFIVSGAILFREVLPRKKARRK